MSEMFCIQVKYTRTKTLVMKLKTTSLKCLNKDRKHLIQRVHECIFLKVKKKQKKQFVLFAINVHMENLLF